MEPGSFGRSGSVCGIGGWVGALKRRWGRAETLPGSRSWSLAEAAGIYSSFLFSRQDIMGWQEARICTPSSPLGS